MIRSKKNPKVVTSSKLGEENGFLIPILNIHEKFVEKEQWPKQIYCTVVEPEKVKGPHLHYKRWGMFTCIRGNVKVVIKVEEHFEEYFSGDDHEYCTIQIPAGLPAAIVNIGDIDAYVLNMPAPSWHPDENDDWDADFGDYDFFGRAKGTPDEA